MTRKFKRGYIQKGWFNALTNKYAKDEYAVSISKVIQSDEFGKFEDVDEDEIRAFGGFKTIEEAKEFLNKEFKCKEIEICE